MSGGLQRIHAAVLLPLIGILAIVVIGLTGSSYETYFSESKVLKANLASELLLQHTGPAATLAFAAVIAGAWYTIGKVEGWVTAAAALATALIAWAYGLVAFGFACKHAEIGVPETGLSGSLKGLAGVTIFLVLIESIYVVLLHLVISNTATSS